MGGEGVATELDNDDLHYHGGDPDDEEDPVGEDAREDVALTVDLARVELVEEGHEHEGVEDGREVLCRLRDSMGHHLTGTIALQNVFAWHKHKQ